MPTGCTVSFQVSVNGVLSNSTFIAIAPDANASACVMPGFTTQQLQNFDNGGTYTIGSFSLSSIIGNGGGLQRQVRQRGRRLRSDSRGFQLSGTAQYSATHSEAARCSTSLKADRIAGIDRREARHWTPGQVTLTGPSASNINNLALTETDNTYYASLSSFAGLGGSTNYLARAGTYTLKGAGGKDVGAFNTSITMGESAHRERRNSASHRLCERSGLPLTWTGGNASD